MDLGVAFIGGILVVICVLPFVWIQVNKARAKNSIMQSLKEVADKHNRKIGEHEFCADFVLGFDVDERYVFFSNSSNEQVVTGAVDLTSVKRCNAAILMRNADRKSAGSTRVDKVELRFFPKENKGIETTFELFDEVINEELVGELQLAEKWAELINRKL